jgi:methionyl-tRNA formyltransferase
MKISFWGSSDFSLEILKTLHDMHKVRRINLAFVVSQPPKPFGRKKELKHNLVAEYCIDNEIPLLLPNKVGELFEPFTLQKYYAPDFSVDDLRCDISIVAAYGKIIPQKALDTAEFGFLNFHGSILPKYRGAIPVQKTIWNQDATGGITVIKMDKGMDTGDIITKYEYPIAHNMTSGELMNELAEVSAKMLDRNFDLLFNHENWRLEKQNDSEATYCYVSDFSKEKLEVLYTDSVIEAHGKIQAANPEPKAWGVVSMKDSGRKMNIIRSFIPEAALSDTPSEHTGRLSLHTSVDKTKLFLEVHNGFLQILEIQPEGKNSMDARSFINGYLR